MRSPWRSRSCERSANASWSARAMPNSLGHVVRGLRHRVGAELLAHHRVDEPPADGGVVDLGGPGERRRRPWACTNGARVMLSTPPASTRSASPERTARDAMAIASRLDPQSRFTVPPGADDRQSREQGRHPGDVAVVLAGLVRAAEQHVVQLRPSRPTAAGRSASRSTWAARSSGRTVGQRAAVPAERRPHPGHQERLTVAWPRLSHAVMTHPMIAVAEPELLDLAAGRARAARASPPAAPASTAGPGPSRRGTAASRRT